MGSHEFFERRNEALAYVTAGRLKEGEDALRALFHACQTSEASHCSPLVQSDLAVALAKGGARQAAEENMEAAYREGCRSHPLVHLLVTHNRAVMCDVFGEPEQSVGWAFQTAQIVRLHERVLPQLGGRTAFDCTMFTIGAQALHVVIDFYCRVAPDLMHARKFVPEALAWISKAIEADGAESPSLLQERTRLLALQACIEGRR